MSGGRTLTVKMPLPPRELSPNGSFGSWKTHAPAVAAYRSVCEGLARERMGSFFGPPMRRATLHLRFVYGGKPTAPRTEVPYRPYDVDNAVAACKPLIDGLVRAGALLDDKWKCLELGGCRIEGAGRDGEVIAVLNER